MHVQFGGIRVKTSLVSQHKKLFTCGLVEAKSYPRVVWWKTGILKDLESYPHAVWGEFE